MSKFIRGFKADDKSVNKSNKIDSNTQDKIINFYDKIDTGAPRYNPNSHMPKHEFRAIIVGQSGSGKTNFLCNLITKCECFERFIICTKMPDEPLYQFLKQKVESVDENRFIIMDKVESLGTIEDYGDKLQTLIVFDDMCLENRRLQELMSQYYIRGRKSNMSTVYLSQSYYLVPKVIRLQCGHVFLKKIGSKREINAIIRDYNLDVEVDDLMEIYNKATEDMVSALHIDVNNNNPDLKFRKNFDTEAATA